MTLPPTLRAFSQSAITQGSQSFARAARLFSPTVRDDAILLYAWCRHADDVIDGQVLGKSLGHNTQTLTPEAQAQRLHDLRLQTAQALQGHADTPPFQALAYVMQRHAIPAAYTEHLLDGFAMDVTGHTYATEDDLLLYAYRVAGVVGRMMAHIMGVSATETDTLQRATDLGLAFQLTNIARDLYEDAHNGRCYLPATWLKEEGLTPANVIAGAPQGLHNQILHRLALRLLTLSEPYYASARIGLRRLPYRSALAIGTALDIYRAIGTQIRRQNAAPAQRAHTSATQKGLYVLKNTVSVLLPVHETPRTNLWTYPLAPETGSQNS